MKTKCFVDLLKLVLINCNDVKMYQIKKKNYDLLQLDEKLCFVLKLKIVNKKV